MRPGIWGVHNAHSLTHTLTHKHSFYTHSYICTQKSTLTQTHLLIKWLTNNHSHTHTLTHSRSPSHCLTHTHTQRIVFMLFHSLDNHNQQQHHQWHLEAMMTLYCCCIVIHDRDRFRGRHRHNLFITLNITSWGSTIELFVFLVNRWMHRYQTVMK